MVRLRSKSTSSHDRPQTLSMTLAAFCPGLLLGPDLLSYRRMLLPPAVILPERQTFPNPLFFKPLPGQGSYVLWSLFGPLKVEISLFGLEIPPHSDCSSCVLLFLPVFFPLPPASIEIFWPCSPPLPTLYPPFLFHSFRRPPSASRSHFSAVALLNPGNSGRSKTSKPTTTLIFPKSDFLFLLSTLSELASEQVSFSTLSFFPLLVKFLWTA